MKRKLQILRAYWLVNWHCICYLTTGKHNHRIMTISFCNSYKCKIVCIKCNCGKIYFGEETQVFEDIYAREEYNI